MAIASLLSGDVGAWKKIGEGLNHWWFKRRFGPKVRAEMYEDLSAFTAANMPLYQAIAAIRKVYERREAKKASRFIFARMFAKGAPLLPMVREWNEKIEAGASFSQAVRRWVPPEEVGLLSGGEESGDMRSAFDEVARLCRQRAEMRSMLWSKLTMPIFLLMFLAGFIYYVAATVVPTAKGLVPESATPGITASYFAFGEFFINWAWAVLIGLIGMGFVIGASMPRWRGDIRAMADNVFPYTLYRMTQSGFLLITMAAMMRANITTTNALTALTKNSSPYIHAHLTRILTELKSGKTEAEAFDTGLLPAEASDRLRIYSRLPDFSIVMGAMGRDVVVMMRNQLTKFAIAMNISSLLAITGFILYTIFALGLLSMSISDSVQSQV